MQSALDEVRTFPVSTMAENLVGSEIIKLAGQIKARIAAGEDIYNFTIGDFNPDIFPIPEGLKNEIIAAYEAGHTNYPAANGLLELRSAVNRFVNRYGKFPYSDDEFLVSGGARPLIYAAYQTVVDPGDTVVFPVPSWNNNHYSHLAGAKPVFLETTPENHFMPSAEAIAPHLKDAALVAVCSPLNPTGTTFTEDGLAEICDAILAENQRRGPGKKPVYLIYDQIYWILTHGTTHYHPVQLRPEMRPFTIYIDGISKAFAATGVRVGWACGPEAVINKMRAILSHVGAWSPKAEQVATAKFLDNDSECDTFLDSFKSEISDLLNTFYDGFTALKSEGFKVDAIAPQAAIYLTVQFDLKGQRTPDDKVLESTEDVTAYLLQAAGLAIVPFYAFGADRGSAWFRLSVGTARKADLPELFERLRKALSQLT